MDTNAWLIYFFFILSTIFLLVGVLVHTGVFKGWWLINSTPVTPIGIFYALIPSSLLFLILGVLIKLPLTPEKRGDMAMYILTPLMIVILVLATWQPRWLKPKWLRWLEDNHNALLPLLREDAKRMGARKWEKRVNTQEGLENWVEEVRRKNKFDHLDQRFIGNPHAK